MLRTRFVIGIAAAGSVVASPLAGSAGQGWGGWEARVSHLCASHHLEWVGDGGPSELAAAYVGTLSPRDRLAVARSEQARCRDEAQAVSCRMGVEIAAIDRLRRAARFAAFSCAHVRCRERDDCTVRPPA